MNILLLDLSPKRRGPTTFLRNVAIGLQALGHTATIAGITKSGKARKDWCQKTDYQLHNTSAASPGVVDAVIKQSEFFDVTSEFDAVFVNEPRDFVMDKAAQKDGTTPEYVRLLHGCRAPWTTYFPAMNGGARLEDAPFLPLLVDSPTYVGSLACHESFVPVPLATAHPVVVCDALPFQPVTPVDAPAPSKHALLMAGRFSYTKAGWGLALALWLRGSEAFRDLPVSQCGAGPISLGSSLSYQMAELAATIPGVRATMLPGKRGLYYCDPFILERDGQAPWTFHGGYHEHTELNDKGWLQLNLSDARHHATFEYVGLEALDRGCTVIAGHELDPRGELAHQRNPTSEMTYSITKREIRLMARREVTCDLLDWTEQTLIDWQRCSVDTRNANAIVGRQRLRTYADPRIFAEALLKLLLS